MNRARRQTKRHRNTCFLTLIGRLLLALVLPLLSRVFSPPPLHPRGTKERSGYTCTRLSLPLILFFSRRFINHGIDRLVRVSLTMGKTLSSLFQFTKKQKKKQLDPLREKECIRHTIVNVSYTQVDTRQVKMCLLYQSRKPYRRGRDVPGSEAGR